MNNKKVVLKTYLSDSDYKLVSALEKKCLSFDKTSLKLELEYKMMTAKDSVENISQLKNEFMYFVDDKLVAYIGLCCFDGIKIEINGMVDPNYRRQGLFKVLFEAVKEECAKRRASDILLLSDNMSKSGVSFIEANGGDFKFAEYEMNLDFSITVPRKGLNISLHQANNSHVKQIAIIDHICFKGGHEDDVIDLEHFMMPELEAERGMIIYLVKMDDEIIGKINLEINEKCGGIYGFCVLGEYRRKGLGREILLIAIEKFKAEKCEKIVLQVEIENRKALDLYIDCGFKEVYTMNYYGYSTQ